MQPTLQDYCKACPAFNPFFSSLALVLTAGEEGSGARSSLSLSTLLHDKHSSLSADFKICCNPAKQKQGKQRTSIGENDAIEMRDTWHLPGHDPALD